MARKRRKIRRKKGFGRWFSWMSPSFGFISSCIPLAVTLSLSTFLFLGMREALYADSNLTVMSVVVDPPASLSAGARKYLDSKLLGENLLSVDLKSVARQVQKNPDIKKARLIRDFPGTVRVEVEKRDPIAFLRLSPSGPFGVVADDGMVLDKVSQKNSSLVMIEAFGMRIRNPRIGSQIKDRGFVRAIEFLKAFWKHPLAEQETVTKMSLDNQGNVSVVLSGGPEVRLGRDPETRLAALQKITHLLEGENRHKIEYIDLQYENIVVKRKFGR